MSKYIGATVVNLSVDTVDVTGDITATDSTPELILLNDTHEDTDGGREGKVTFKGEQSGGEVTVLAQIQSGHDGTSDDEKGELIFKTNDGNDGSSPSEVMRIDSLGNVGIGTDTIDVSTQAGGSGYQALQIESDEGGQLNFDHNDAGTGSTLGQINFQRAGEVVAEIEGVTDGATDNGKIAFRTQPDGGALTERMRIDHNGYVTTPAVPSFMHASYMSYTVPAATTANFTNSNVFSANNAGLYENGDSGWDFSTGVFTAPVAGRYFFSMSYSLSGFSSGYFWVYMQVNAVSKTYNQNSQQSNLTPTTNSMVVELAANDSVRVVFTNNYSGMVVNYANFHGFLIG